ncbi:hypothetical protein [Rhodopseudomonas sp.]|uniref:hypothetical protein n=1 Tax=Rhodopseudomonas sp. TaxID=1078 RepID=UPI0039E4BF02
MRRILTKAADCFVTANADRILISGVAIAAAFAAAFVLSGLTEGVLRIPGGVGFLQNYGLIAAILGDAVLFFLAKKYLECCQEIAKPSSFGPVKGVRTLHIQFLRDLRLKTPLRFILYLFVIVGLIALVGNTSLHIRGALSNQWTEFVFDSLDHPLSFATNKAFSLYSWLLVLPFCAYISIVATRQISRITEALDRNESVKYDLLHSDNAGGFAQMRIATFYFNLGVLIIYLQIALYTLTFNHANGFQLGAYAATTGVLLFGNFAMFGRIDKMISNKERLAHDQRKNKAYQGDRLNFEILKYYTDVFSKNSLQKRLTAVTISLKSAAIAIPPILKMMTLAPS